MHPHNQKKKKKKKLVFYKLFCENNYRKFKFEISYNGFKQFFSYMLKKFCSFSNIQHTSHSIKIITN